MNDRSPHRDLEPGSAGAIAWNAIVSLVTTAMAILVPLELVFSVRSHPAARLIDACFTIVCLIDIPFRLQQFREANPESADPDEALHRPRLLTFMFRWLSLDLIAAIPFHYLLGTPRLELLRLVKLARVGQFMRVWRRGRLRFADQMLIVFVLYWMLLVGHGTACGWIALRVGPMGENAATEYVDAVYWTVTTLTTVGYGDITPRTDAEKLYAVGTMVAGLAFFGYLVGLLASIWGKRDPARARFEAQIDRLAVAVRYGYIPRSLERRLYDYHYYMWQHRLGYDESEFLSELPRNLRAEVSLHLKRDLLERCELFTGTDVDFMKELAIHLRPMVLTPGDTVFREGDEGREMYFVARGELDVIANEGRRIATMGPGDFFGEIALILDVPRTATVAARSYCDVYTLSGSNFDRVMARRPDVHARVEREAKRRHGRSTADTDA